MDQILMLSKNRRDRQLLEETLAPNYTLVPEGVEEPIEEDFDLAIIDGPSLKKLGSKLRARRKTTEPVFLPCLLLTTRRKGSMPTRHLGRLVDDVILRPIEPSELRARVANLLRRRRLSLDLKKEHDRVVRLSVTDDVSGFYNTRYLHRKLDRLLAAPASQDEEHSLVFFDLDNFKEVVDTHGHLLGSKMLKEVAQVVSHVLEEDDRIVRYGGDEYVVVLPRQGKTKALVKVALMQEAISSATFLDKETPGVFVTASFGLATYPQDARNKRELLAEADRCLFKSKRLGKNRISSAGLGSLDENRARQMLETA